MSKLIQFVKKDNVLDAQVEDVQLIHQTTNSEAIRVQKIMGLENLLEVSNLLIRDYVDVSIQLTGTDPGPDDTPWLDPPPEIKII